MTISSLCLVTFFMFHNVLLYRFWTFESSCYFADRQSYGATSLCYVFLETCKPLRGLRKPLRGLPSKEYWATSEGCLLRTYELPGWLPAKAVGPPPQSVWRPVKSYCYFDINRKDVFCLTFYFQKKMFYFDWLYLIRKHLLFCVCVCVCVCACVRAFVRVWVVPKY